MIVVKKPPRIIARPIHDDGFAACIAIILCVVFHSGSTELATEAMKATRAALLIFIGPALAVAEKPGTDGSVHATPKTGALGQIRLSPEFLQV
jgi:hypothetical protein